MTVVAETEAAVWPPMQRVALVLYPRSESYTTTAICKAFRARLPQWTVCSTTEELRQLKKNDHDIKVDLQMCDYDEIDWDLAEESSVLTNAYMLRKALIRKSYLSSTVSRWLSKHPKSILSRAVPETYPFQIAHADELDELLCDELYEVARSFQAVDATGLSTDERPWWILKPAMADKGQGIRIFDSISALQNIMTEFEDTDSEEDDEDEQRDNECTDQRNLDRSGLINGQTKVRLSQMRDWVVQRYICRPLLLKSGHLPISHRKFHLRVYTLVVGSLQAFIYTDILALFASRSYSLPGEDAQTLDELSRHLTNTCLQDDDEAATSIYLLRDLVNCAIANSDDVFTNVTHDEVVDKIGHVIGECVLAAAAMPNHFSVAQNCFEVFGADLVLSNSQSSGEVDVQLLEFNACPDFKQSGNDLHHVIERLFAGVIELAVKPFFVPSSANEDWPTMAKRGDWLKCLDLPNAQPGRRA